MPRDSPYPPHLQRAIDEAKATADKLSGTETHYLKLVLPIPPNANHYRGIDWKRKRVFVRKEGVEYRAEVKKLGLEAGVRNPMLGPVSVALRIFRARKAGDMDGFEKVLFDCLQGVAYVNDNQIRHKVVHLADDKDRPRVEVEVTHMIDPLFESSGEEAAHT